MLGTTFLFLRTFLFFGTHDSTLSQFSYLTDYSTSFTKSTSSPGYRNIPMVLSPALASPTTIFLPDLTDSHGFPVSVSSPGLSRL